MTRLPMCPALGAGLLAALVLAGAACASPLTLVPGQKGTFDVTVVKATADSLRDQIVISYRPDSTKVSCNPIYLVQTCRDRDQNGNVIQPKDYKTGAFRHLQDDMAWAGTYVDHVVCEKDPFYNGEDAGKDAKSAGSANGTSSTSTRMSDAPHIRGSSFPDGVDRVTSTFEVCAVCKADSAILDCVTWTWTHTRTESGKGTITGPTRADTASLDFRVALAKYKSNHRYGMVCPEEVAESVATGRNVGVAPNKKTPLDPPVAGQPSMVQWDIVNTSTQDVMNVTWTVALDGLPLASGVVPIIGWFDFATVDFPLPPLPEGPHVLVLLVDPEELIPEYDETDNLGLDEFWVRPATAVGPAGPAVRLGITSLLPNPTRGRVAATLSLPDAGRATLELVDLSGRRVREFSVAGPGVQTVRLELGGDVGPGLYLLRLKQAGQEAVRKLTIVR